ncbi:MAG: putative DNA-binding domain-containing protein [Planctomycetaceae bacterium]
MTSSSSQPQSDAPQLHDIQQWMQQLIAHPAGVQQGIEAGVAREQLDVTAENLEAVISRSQQLTSIERLQIYNHAYFARLIECLRAEFPALQHALGESVFDGFAFDYIRRYPSRSYTLADLGKHFPAYLIESRGETFGSSATEGWTDFLIDLARLERLYADVFDGPGIEELPPFPWDRFQSLAPDDFTRVKVLMNPAFRLIELKYPVQHYVSAVRHLDAAHTATAPHIPDPHPTLLAVTRRDYIVHRAPLLERQYVLLGALQQGHSLAAALEQLFEAAPDLPEEIGSALHEDFREWTRLGYICGLEIDS